MDVPYFIKDHFWMSASDKATLKKKNLAEVSPRESWPWEQSGMTVVAVMIHKVVNIWISML